MDNSIFRELADEEECFSLKSDERVYLDLKQSFDKVAQENRDLKAYIENRLHG